MAYSFQTHTKLCLDRWADLLGVNPLAFNNLSVANCIEPWDSPCKFWTQNSYQSNLSIEQLATFVKNAETQIESFLGMYVKPTYTYGEILEVPYFYRREDGKLRLEDMKFQTKWKNVLNFGQNKRIFLGDADIVYTDSDGDGFFETATITIQTDITIDDLCGIELTLCNTEQCNSFCPIKHIDYNELEGILTITSDTWLFRKAEVIQNGFITRIKAVDACDLTNFLDCVGVFYNYVDKCLPDVEVVWQKKDNCTSGDCEEIIIPACAFLLDSCRGIFQIKYQQYNETTNCLEPISSNCVLPCYPPDFIRVNYNSGCIDKFNYSQNACKNCRVCDKLEWAVAVLAATFLPEFYCNCDCVGPMLRNWQTNVAAKNQGSISYNYAFSQLSNPFGATLGGIQVYTILLQILDNLCN